MPEIDTQISGPEEVPAPTPLFQTAILVSLAVAVLCLFVFAWLGREMAEGETLRFDNAVRGWVHQFASSGMTRAMTIISALGYGFLLFALVVAFMFFARLRWLQAALWLAITMAGALLLDISLKYAYHRHRPAAFFGTSPESYSFPSGHALCSLCFYGVLAGLLSARIQSLLWRIVIWSVAAALVIAIGFSRIYLGVHYPSDVLAGYLAATMWVGTVIVLDHLRKVRRSARQNSAR